MMVSEPLGGAMSPLDSPLYIHDTRRPEKTATIVFGHK